MPKQTPSNPITDAIVDLHFAPCFAAMDSPYSYVKSFAEKHSKKERWGWVYYSAAKERYEARYGKINEKIDEHIESISNAIKSSLLSRYEHVAQLEQEIKEIQAILDAGYIAKVITINGAKHEKIEILATKEIKQLEDLKDRMLFPNTNFLIPMFLLLLLEQFQRISRTHSSRRSLKVDQRLADMAQPQLRDLS